MKKQSKPLKAAIIIPVYNTKNYLVDCFNSIISQTYKNFIAIIIDDGSTDGSQEICDLFSRKDPRFICIHKKNEGVSVARNTALDLVEQDESIDIVLFLDSDDKLTSKALETVIDNIKKFDADFLTFGFSSFDKKGIGNLRSNGACPPPLTLTSEEALTAFLSLKHKFHWQAPYICNTAIKRTQIKGLRFDTSLTTAEDQDFKIRILCQVNCVIAISNILLLYRLRKNSLSHSKDTSSTDMKMFFNWLDRKKQLPISVQFLIEEQAINQWWLMLRKLVENSSLTTNWRMALSAYETLAHKCSITTLKKFQYRKRFFLFSLGRHALWLYFILFNRRKKLDQNNSAYE